MKGQTMHTRLSAIARGGALAILVLALLGALTGCGVGRASNQEKISKTVDTYLRALAGDDGTLQPERRSPRARQSRQRMANRLRLHARPNASVTNQKENLTPLDGELLGQPVRGVLGAAAVAGAAGRKRPSRRPSQPALRQRLH